MSAEPADPTTSPGKDSPPYPLPATQKRSLLALCLAVLCERFSFFLLISVLVLFLNERCGYPGSIAVRAYGLFISGCYLTPLIGGRLCDGKLGPARTMFLGLWAQICGFLLLRFVQATPLALALIALGTGLFKAGTQTLIGSLRVESEVEQNRLFSTIYVVVNVSALLAPILAGLLPADHDQSQFLRLLLVFALLGLASLWPWLAHATGPVQTEHIVETTSSPSSLRLLRLGLILLAGALFAAAFVQSHSTLLLFVRDHVDRRVGPFILPVAWFAAAPGGLVLIMSPLSASVFSLLRNQNREPSTIQKLALGLIITALAYIPICGAVYSARIHHTVSPVWVLSCLALLALGEILVAVLAPAEIARIAPADKRGRWMSYWFVATAIGNAIGGWVEW